ncbi:Protein kinase domain-containing protein [Aphelenchoides besseyi]|nr:Protein kinase domain-containing protein [Aphelenchoides besseyi]
MNLSFDCPKRQGQTSELSFKNGELLLLTSEAAPINERLDDASDHSSVYSDDLELILDAQEDFEQQQMTKQEITERLLSFGLDRDGLPVRPDLLFANFEQAAEFCWSSEEVNCWHKWLGYECRPIEEPHIVLWDYEGGTSCLDLSCSAGDVVNVMAEEYQVRFVGELFKDCGHYMRLPQRWSLARWMNNKTFEPLTGLIPSSWLISKKFHDALENRHYFKRTTWFLGTTDFSSAYEKMLDNRSSHRAGLFVIFSPQWLNLDPADHRPFVLLVMCQKAIEYVRETVRLVDEQIRPQVATQKLLQLIANARREQTTRRTPTPLAMTPDTVQSSAPSVINPLVSIAPTERQTARSETQTATKTTTPQTNIQSPNQQEEPDELFAEHVSTPYYVKSYTISRSSLGRYLLFDHQYETLYDLVYHLSNFVSPLPHLLDGGPLSFGKHQYFNAIPSPPKPTRDLYSLTMQMEQIAARHFDQVAEPAVLRRAFDYVYKTVFNPFKRTHKEYAESAGLSNAVVEEARAFCDQYQQPKKKEADKLPANQMPKDEAELRPMKGVQLDANRLEFNEEDLLGAGAFGSVYRGKLKIDGDVTIPVAVKKLEIEPPSDEKQQAWIAEMEVLQVVSHPNVACFYGFCYDEKQENTMLALELMNCGALADFLRVTNQIVSVNREFKISTNEQVDFLVQIARGMSYLHSLDPPIIHGDLAARNVLMQHHPIDRTRYILKVSDFGLSKTCRHDVHFYPDNPNKLPFKWLPPEVLQRSEMNVKADVWAFGVTAIEFFGVQEPYGILGAERIFSMCKEGHRMERPASMPIYIYDVILRCWRFQPVDRPSFVEIVDRLQPFYIENETQHLNLIANRLTSDKEEMKKNKGL